MRRKQQIVLLLVRRTATVYRKTDCRTPLGQFSCTCQLVAREISVLKRARAYYIFVFLFRNRIGALWNDATGVSSYGVHRGMFIMRNENVVRIIRARISYSIIIRFYYLSSSSNNKRLSFVNRSPAFCSANIVKPERQCSLSSSRPSDRATSDKNERKAKP